ncbi:hypothetical protein ACE6H2_018788 [Prunus campanulata]
MASAPRSSSWFFNLSENWLPMATMILICGFVGYVVYDAVMATVSELLQRLLVISPLLIVIVVHWLSTGSQVSISIPGSEPGAIHRAGGSPWAYTTICSDALKTDANGTLLQFIYGQVALGIPLVRV